MTPEQELHVANEIKARRCPFGHLEKGQTMAHCPLGFPGCGCGDEWMVNPHLTDIPGRDPTQSTDDFALSSWFRRFVEWVLRKGK
jgi:hypothetical protein